MLLISICRAMRKVKCEPHENVRREWKKRSEVGQKTETQMDGPRNRQTDEQTIIDKKLWNNLFAKICMTDCAAANRLW